MSNKEIFVLVPSFNPAGPVKGAVALCNGLVDHFPVTFVSLKPGGNIDSLMLDSRINVISMGDVQGWKRKYKTYKELVLKNAGKDIVSISFCFSSDLLNLFIVPYAKTISSVRGNLKINYLYDYGYLGIVLSYFHYAILRRFDHVIAISDAMYKQLIRLGIKRLSTIHNFIDEKNIDKYRVLTREMRSPFSFIYLGRLSKLKRPNLIIEAIFFLKKKGVDCRLDIVGDGDMMFCLEKMVNKLGLSSFVLFHGAVDNPFLILQSNDCLVMPSESEGISRAALEALFLGLPCIMRAVAGNQELIKPGVNGELFSKDEELIDVMYRMTQHDFADKGRQNMLPDDFRQEPNIRKFYELINKL
jgi:glycosyltransferase involved in cell wall biosynthesis